MDINYTSSNYTSAKKTESKVGQITPKQAVALFESEPLDKIEKLFNGHFDTLEISLIDHDRVNVKWKSKGKPGFSSRDYLLFTIKVLQHDWINSPILNRSGLATLIWDDLTPNNLRRRLEQRAQHRTLSETEKEIIVNEVEQFLHMIKTCFQV
jgi:hypothetical protein